MDFNNPRLCRLYGGQLDWTILAIEKPYSNKEQLRGADVLQIVRHAQIRARSHSESKRVPTRPVTIRSLKLLQKFRRPMLEHSRSYFGSLVQATHQNSIVYSKIQWSTSFYFLWKGLISAGLEASDTPPNDIPRWPHCAISSITDAHCAGLEKSNRIF